MPDTSAATGILTPGGHDVSDLAGRRVNADKSAATVEAALAQGAIGLAPRRGINGHRVSMSASRAGPGKNILIDCNMEAAVRIIDQRIGQGVAVGLMANNRGRLRAA